MQNDKSIDIFSQHLKIQFVWILWVETGELCLLNTDSFIFHESCFSDVCSQIT